MQMLTFDLKLRTVELQPSHLPTKTGIASMMAHSYNVCSNCTFLVVGEAAVHHNGSLPPPLEYTACTFYINKKRNSWVWHFNVTKKLDALIQVL